MKFKFNPATLTVETDDPEISVIRIGKPKELGLEFVLKWRGKTIGFRTADFDLENKTYRLPDGTHVWVFDSVFCRIERPDRELGGTKVLTDTYALSSREEVDMALEIFSNALSFYDGGIERSSAGLAKAKVEFTEKVRRQVESGRFVE